MKKSPLRKVSGNRKKQVNEYTTKSRRYLEEHLVCEVCNQHEANQIHHKKGRQGEMLNQEEFWVAVCQGCHCFIHAHPEAARKEGWLIDRLGHS